MKACDAEGRRLVIQTLFVPTPVRCAAVTKDSLRFGPDLIGGNPHHTSIQSPASMSLQTHYFNTVVASSNIIADKFWAALAECGDIGRMSSEGLIISVPGQHEAEEAKPASTVLEREGGHSDHKNACRNEIKRGGIRNTSEGVPDGIRAPFLTHPVLLYDSAALSSSSVDTGNKSARGTYQPPVHTQTLGNHTFGFPLIPTADPARPKNSPSSYVLVS